MREENRHVAVGLRRRRVVVLQLLYDLLRQNVLQQSVAALALLEHHGRLNEILALQHLKVVTDNK